MKKRRNVEQRASEKRMGLVVRMTLMPALTRQRQVGLCSRSAWSTEQMPGPHRETLSGKTTKLNTNPAVTQAAPTCPVLPALPTVCPANVLRALCTHTSPLKSTAMGGLALSEPQPPGAFTCSVM